MISNCRPLIRISFRENSNTYYPPFKLSRPGCARLLFAVLLGILSQEIHAQTYDRLSELKGYAMEIYFSAGSEEKSRRIALQLEQVISFYKKHLGFSPKAKALILSPDDWEAYAGNVIYGMPHYGNNQTLFIASEDNNFWRSFIPPLDRLPGDQARLVSNTYTNAKGVLTMEPFFDLLAIHELGHAFHIQDSLVMQRKWMGELFANIFLHTYVANVEPDLLPALTVFPEMVVASTDITTLKYTSLSDLEDHYRELGQNYPMNYGWYQCRWHMAARHIYDEAGVAAISKLWIALKSQRKVLEDALLERMLGVKVHKSVAEVPIRWSDR